MKFFTKIKTALFRSDVITIAILLALILLISTVGCSSETKTVVIESANTSTATTKSIIKDDTDPFMIDNNNSDVSAGYTQMCRRAWYKIGNGTASISDVETADLFCDKAAECKRVKWSNYVKDIDWRELNCD